MATTAGEAPRALSQKEQDIQVMLAADVYLGTKNCDFQMEIEDHASKVRNSEGCVTMGLSEFTALALNNISSKLQSTYWSNLCYDIGSSETE
ncbi:40S ribosomal protein SA [Hordeum vulgare]|nr:40S ribosomal protein SA [Hordeum vulgare]